MSRVSSVPTPAMKKELKNTRGMSAEVKNTSILRHSASPKVDLPRMRSALVLVEPTTIQKNGNTDTKAARLSAT